MFPAYYYADVASHPEFGKKAMHLCATELYLEEGRGRNLVTEGVLRTKEIRDRFAHKIHKAISSNAAYIFRAPRLFYLQEDPVVLSNRRPHRSVETYQEMLDAYEVGSARFTHAVLDCGKIPEMAERARWLMDS